MRNPFGLVYVPLLAATLLVIGWKARAEIAQMVLVFVAVQLALSVYSRGDYLFSPTADLGTGIEGLENLVAVTQRVLGALPIGDVDETRNHPAHVAIRAKERDRVDFDPTSHAVRSVDAKHNLAQRLARFDRARVRPLGQIHYRPVFPHARPKIRRAHAQ